VNALATIEPVVTLKGSKVNAISGDVAEMFGKRHDNVLRDIEGLLSHASDLRYAFFQEVTDHHPTVIGRTIRSFNMDRDGFTLLAMGFTGTKAVQFKLAYIRAFNEMEAKLKGPDLPDFSKPAIAAGLM